LLDTVFDFLCETGTEVNATADKAAGKAAVTRSQFWAERAYQRVAAVRDRSEKETDAKKKAAAEKEEKEYKSFAKRFPTLIHECGLAQTLAFAMSRKQGAPEKVVEDLAFVLDGDGKTAGDLAADSRKLGLMEYLRVSRDALTAAGWLKRYAEAMLKGED
jgi:CRISPR-associated protein Cmr5